MHQNVDTVLKLYILLHTTLMRKFQVTKTSSQPDPVHCEKHHHLRRTVLLYRIQTTRFWTNITFSQPYIK